MNALATRPQEEFIRSVPKAELHVHLEGTLEPEMAFECARKHRITLGYRSVEALREAYRFTDLQSFLNLYYACTDVLRGESDFYLLTMAYLRRVNADGVVHVEVFFDPQTHTARGIPFGLIVRGIRSALLNAERTLGITHRLILCFLRHLGPQEAMKTLDEALAYTKDIAGVGLDSTEKGYPPAPFASVFERARAEGFHTVAHAGEEGPPAYIYEALDILRVARVDHGVRSEEDPALISRLARDRTPLTVCPLSNVRLNVFSGMENHNLKRLLERGLCVTVNSDDPAYFGGYVLENYLAVTEALGLSRGQIQMLASNSIEASFLPRTDKDRWLQNIRGVKVEP